MNDYYQQPQVATTTVRSNKKLKLSTIVLTVIVLLLIVLTLLYLFLPRKIKLNLNASELTNGKRVVAIRALDAVDAAKVLKTDTIEVDVENGVLRGVWSLKRSVTNRPYIVEVCTKSDGSNVTVQCFSSLSSANEETANLSDTGGYIVSCPYFVSTEKTRAFSALIGRNVIDLQTRIYCGDSSRGFSKTSKAEAAGRLSSLMPGLNIDGNGLVIAKDGSLEVQGFDTLVEEVVKAIEAKGQSTDQPTSNNPNQAVVNWGTASSGTTQVLSISGNTLSISGGNSVLLPADTNTTYLVANSTTSGILSSSDWNNFASKENSLTISNGLVRAGNTISLMSCAAGQILKNNGTAWVCAADAGGTGGSYTAGTGITIDATDTISATLGTTIEGIEITDGTITSADLSTTGVGAGTYNNVTVDAQGRVTAGTNVSYLTSFTEQDGIVGNEVADVVNNGGLVMTGAGTAASPYRVGLVTTCSDGQLLKYTSASGWACASDVDTDTPNTDSQTLSWNATNNQLTITGGNTVDISSLNTDSQAISLSGDTLSISGNAATVDLSKYLDNTDSQTLSWNNGTRTLSLANGGSVVIPDADTDTNTTYTAGANGGLVLNGTAFSMISCSEGQILKAGAVAGQWECAADLQGITGPIALGTDTTGNYVEGLSAGAGIKIIGTPGEGWSPTVAFADGTADGQYWSWNATTSTWELATALDTNTTYTAGNGLALTGTTFSLSPNGANQGDIMYWDGVQWTPTAVGYNCSTESGGAFCNNGNSFGGIATIGTNDAYGLNFETNGVTTMSISPTGEVLIRDPTDTMLSFRVSDSAGLAHFSVDTERNRITIGGAADSTAIMLVLDAYNIASDPVGANGAMYYNNSLARFRCYEGSMWKDCISPVSKVVLTSAASSNSTTFTPVAQLTTPLVLSRTYTFSCDLRYATGATTNALWVRIVGPTSTNVNVNQVIATNYTATHSSTYASLGYTPVNPDNGTPGGSTAMPISINGTFTTTANGNFAVEIASETNGNSATLYGGACEVTW